MDIEQYFEEALGHTDLSGVNQNLPGKWKSAGDSRSCSDDNPSRGFDCNICLDSVQDPVVTLCGHLYCWPCIYKWLHFQSMDSESQDEKHQQCPVCKSEVSKTSLIPLYGRGLTTKHSKGKAPHLDLVIPKRPLRPACELLAPRSRASPQFSRQFHHGHSSHQSHMMYYSQQGSFSDPPMLSSGSTNLIHPVIGMLGDMVYTRIFGDSITSISTYRNTYNQVGNTSPRIRRHVLQADKSLSRISFFLFCCLLLCLLLF